MDNNKSELKLSAETTILSGSGSSSAGLVVIRQLIVEVEGVKEEDFGKWYEKKRKLFNIGIKGYPTKDEFVKYLNYAVAAIG